MKMLILTFEEFNNNFGIDNKAMSNIRLEDIGKDIILTPIEILMRNQNSDNISEPNFNIIVNLHPTDGTHWVLVIRREDGPVYYFDSLVLRLLPYSWTNMLIQALMREYHIMMNLLVLLIVYI